MSNQKRRKLTRGSENNLSQSKISTDIISLKEINQKQEKQFEQLKDSLEKI
jgi:hypothetical protein